VTLDKTRLPADLWVRMLWLPRSGDDSQDLPIALVRDRRRFRLGLIPIVLAIPVAIALLFSHGSPVLAILVVLLTFAGYQIGAGGKSGYYEVRPDGSLGDFLGKRTPVGLPGMERMAPE
jgi:hypothetical protein